MNDSRRALFKYKEEDVPVHGENQRKGVQLGKLTSDNDQK